MSPKPWRVGLLAATLVTCAVGDAGRAMQAQAPSARERDAGHPGRPGAVKPLLIGLVSMESARCLNNDNNHCVPDNAMSDAFATPNVLAGVVVNVTWAQLEPRAGEFSFQPIEAALQTLERYNSQHGEHPLHAILRVETGQMAPDWVKTQAGGPVSIIRRSSKAPITVPLFWTPDYRKAWRELQDRLAARYDADPLIAQISNTSCAHESDEPYVNPVDSPSIIALYRAGYTNQKYKDCLIASIHDYDAWRATRVDFTQNAFQNIVVETASGAPQGRVGPADLPFTISVIRQFRAVLGEERAIIGNHDITWPPHPAAEPLYRALRALGKPIEFQTGSPGVTRAGGASTGEYKDWNGTIQLGAEIGATAIEVWPSYAVNGRPIQDGWNPIACSPDVPAAECSGQPRDRLVAWARQLAANAGAISSVAAASMAQREPARTP